MILVRRHGTRLGHSDCAQVDMTSVHQSCRGLGSGQTTVEFSSNRSPPIEPENSEGQQLRRRDQSGEVDTGSMDLIVSACSIEMRRGLARSATGMVTVSTPFS